MNGPSPDRGSRARTRGATPIKIHAGADAGLERIKKLERLLAASPANSLQRRNLTAAIRIEATVYRRSLDADQAAATLGPRPTRTKSWL